MNLLVRIAIQLLEVAETAMKPLQVLLQKHSRSGCTIELPLVGHLILLDDTLFY